jgi:ABC-2 type transport system ATP-binding protein
MNIICNIVSKDEGAVKFADGGSENGGTRRKIGYLTETPSLHGFMNGHEYLRYIAACANYEGDVNRRIAEVLDVTGMTEGATRRIKGYSRGMTQRLGIAAAMFNNPELLILDEPTSALDPEGRAEVMGIIRNLRDCGATIILCTHIITDVERVANKIGIMKNGIIAEEGSIDEILTKYRSRSSNMTITLAYPDDELAAEMRLLPSISYSEYNPVSGRVTLGAANSEIADALFDELISFVYRKKMRVTEIVTQRTTLEDIYFMITGGGSQGGVPQ